MSRYRRAYQKGGCYFFTVVTYERKQFLTQSENLQRLRNAFRHVMIKRPFSIDAVVVLPDHLHCIWRLPENDADFSNRWRLVKHYFSVAMKSPLTGRAEKKLWQRRFWEHLIRDEKDWRRHMDYIHYNPVKHDYVDRPFDWPYGSFREAVKQGWYSEDWGAGEPESIMAMDVE